MNQAYFAPGSELQLAAAAAKRKQLLAAALQQQAMQSPRGGMAGNVFVGPSVTQGLAQMLQAYGSKKLGDEADSDLATAQSNQDAKTREASSRFVAALQPEDGSAPDTKTAMSIALENLDNPLMQQYLQSAFKRMGPEEILQYRDVMGENGPQIMGLTKSGKAMPTNLSPAAKLHFTDNGAAIQGTNPFTGAPVGDAVQKVATPGQELSHQDREAALEGTGVDLTPEALDEAAIRFNIDGELPKLGIGKNAAAAKTAIINRATQLHSEGTDAHQANLNRISGKADETSIRALQKSSDTIATFDKNFNGAVDLVEPLIAKINNGQYPGLNKVSQLLSYQGGNPDIKAAQNQLTTAMMDYQKLVTAGMNVSSAELSVGAQARAEKLLSLADNPETFKREIQIMKRDAAIKADSINSTLTAAQTRMRDRGRDGTGSSKQSTSKVPPLTNSRGWKLHYDSVNKSYGYVGPNGEVEEVQ